jgi:hypothetical protein
LRGRGDGSVTERTESAEQDKKTPVDDECIPFLVYSGQLEISNLSVKMGISIPQMFLTFCYQSHTKKQLRISNNLTAGSTLS